MESCHQLRVGGAGHGIWRDRLHQMPEAVCISQQHMRPTDISYFLRITFPWWEMERQVNQIVIEAVKLLLCHVECNLFRTQLLHLTSILLAITVP